MTMNYRYLFASFVIVLTIANTSSFPCQASSSWEKLTKPKEAGVSGHHRSLLRSGGGEVAPRGDSSPSVSSQFDGKSVGAVARQSSAALEHYALPSREDLVESDRELGNPSSGPDTQEL